MSARVLDISDRLPPPCDCAHCIVERLRLQLLDSLEAHEGQLLVSADAVERTVLAAVADLDFLLAPRPQEAP